MTEQKLTLPITGMTCANCAANIERVVKKLDGVGEANMNFAAESAAVSFDPQQLQLKDVIEKIHKSGFGVATAKVEMPVNGMTCANCAANIERILNKKVSGILKAAVNFASERVRVEYIPGALDYEDIVRAIEKAGYGAIAPQADSDEDDVEQQARDAEIKDQTCSVREGKVEKPDLTLKADAEVGTNVLMGKTDPMKAFLFGKIKVVGDIAFGMKLAKLFS